MYKLLLIILVIVVNNFAQVKIACLGDSITESGWDSIQKNYPDRLQDKLGGGYYVRNFGRGGATIIERGSYPYIQQYHWDQAKTFDPDLVICMLGSNDSGEGLYQWYLTEMYDDYERIMSPFNGKEVYIALPPHHLNPVQDDRIHKFIKDVIKPFAKNHGYNIIDTHQGINWVSSDFSDSVHPNDAGLEKIATAVYNSIKGVLSPISVVPTPTGLFGAYIEPIIELKWDAIPGATYKIYRGVNEYWAPLYMETPNNSMIDLDVDKGNIYYYAVSARQGGQESLRTSLIVIDTTTLGIIPEPTEAQKDYEEQTKWSCRGIFR